VILSPWGRSATHSLHHSLCRANALHLAASIWRWVPSVKRGAGHVRIWVTIRRSTTASRNGGGEGLQQGWRAHPHRARSLLASASVPGGILAHRETGAHPRPWDSPVTRGGRARPPALTRLAPLVTILTVGRDDVKPRPRRQPVFTATVGTLLTMALLVACVPAGTEGAAFSIAVAAQPATATSAPPTLTPTATITPTVTDAPTSTPTPTASAMPTPTATATPSPTHTPAFLPTPDGVVRALRVPILMYHHISEPTDPDDALSVDLSVPPEAFEEHLLYLQRAGYQAVSLADLVLALQTGHPLPQKPIILTFDDGYRDHYDHAFPLLMECGYTGTFFVVTGFIDQELPEYLSWDQVIEMHAAGMDIQPHSYTHPNLRDQPLDYVIWQVLGSKEAIEHRTHEPARFFCYPAGEYDDQVIDVLRAVDFWGAVLVAQGAEHRSDALYELRRIRIHGYYGGKEVLGAIKHYMTLPTEEAE